MTKTQSDIRKRNAAKLRADKKTRDKATLKAVTDSLFQAASRHMSVTLHPNMVRLLAHKLKADERGPKRGPPNQLAAYHEMMAADVLWLRGKGGKAIVAQRIVCERWGVSRSAVEEAVRQHGDAARRLLDMIKGGAAHVPDVATPAEADAYKRSIDDAIKVLIESTAQRFRALAESET